MHSEKSEFLQDTLDFIGSPVRTIKLWTQDLSRVDERLRDDSIVVRLLALATMPFRLFAGFLSMMVQNWPTSRSGLAAILGVPAFFTLIGLLGAWTAAEKLRSNTVRIGVAQGFAKLNLEAFAKNKDLANSAQGFVKEELEEQAQQYANSALTYGEKLVELDPEDINLKFQLGLAKERAGDAFGANNIMMGIAPDDEQGYLQAHLWRAQYLVQGKSAEEVKASLGLIEKHLAMASAADKESIAGKAGLAQVYMTYANLLENEPEERLKYLEKADEEFREIIADKNDKPGNRSVRIDILRASVLIRKQLEAVAPEKYFLEDETARVKHRISELRKYAVNDYSEEIGLWKLLADSASEIGEFDFAVEIINQGLKVAEGVETKRGLQKIKSLVLRRAALTITKFDDFEMYKKRLFYLCDATRFNPLDRSNYILLLQFIGKENEKPTIEFARQLGLSDPGDAVPIKPEWLRRACTETKYTVYLNTLIGIHEFHLGNNEAALLSWTVAQQFAPNSRDFISNTFEHHLRTKQDKLNNFETMLTEFLKAYPEAIRSRMLRGSYYFQQKNFQKAIDDFRVITDANPEELLLHQRIKTCYQYMGQRSAANAEQEIIETKLSRLTDDHRQQAEQALQRLEDLDDF